MFPKKAKKEKILKIAQINITIQMKIKGGIDFPLFFM